MVFASDILIQIVNRFDEGHGEVAPRKNSGWTESLVSKHTVRASAFGPEVVLIYDTWSSRLVRLSQKKIDLTFALCTSQEPAERFSNPSEH